MIDEALGAALSAAPSCKTLAQTARTVNERLGLDWSDAKWRGVWKDHPGDAFLVQKKLGESFSQHVHGQKLHLSGDLKGVTVADAHAPYHDPNAVALAAKVIKWWNPDILVHNGDNVDFSALSKFDPNPARRFRAQDEVDIAQSQVLIPLNGATRKGCKKILLPGNHDLRLLKLMWRQPELFSVRALHLPALFEVEKLGMEYVGYGTVINESLLITHGTRVSQHSGYSARSELAAIGYVYSTITGHVHRSGRHDFRGADGRIRVGQECPCLCGLKPDYCVDPNWVQGLTLWQVRGYDVWMQAVIFAADYRCRIGDKEFEL